MYSEIWVPALLDSANCNSSRLRSLLNCTKQHSNAMQHIINTVHYQVSLIWKKNRAKCFAKKRMFKQFKRTEIAVPTRFNKINIANISSFFPLQMLCLTVSCNSCNSGLYNVKHNDSWWNSRGCRRRLWFRLLWPWRLTFWSQNLISRSTNPNTSATKIGWNPWLLFFDIWCSQGFREAQTHSRTDRPENIMPPPPKVLAKA